MCFMFLRFVIIFVSLLEKIGVKVCFESDEIVMTRNGQFVGKGYSSQGLFMLNVLEIINENASLLLLT